MATRELESSDENQAEIKGKGIGDRNPRPPKTAESEAASI